MYMISSCKLILIKIVYCKVTDHLRIKGSRMSSLETVAKIADMAILISYKVGFRARNITSGIGGYFQSRHSEGNNKDKMRK